MSLSTARPEKSSTTERRRPCAPRGQSFIEAMVAITIIVSSITSALVLVQSSVSASRAAGSQVIAANLAREGIEVARALRDTNWLAGSAFSLGLTDTTFKTALPVLDRATGRWSLAFGDYSALGTETTVWQAGDGPYVQDIAQPSGTSPSVYARAVRLDHLCRDNSTGAERIVTTGTCLVTETLVGLAVSSTVKWASVSGASRSLMAEERLYDWR